MYYRVLWKSFTKENIEHSISISFVSLVDTQGMFWGPLSNSLVVITALETLMLMLSSCLCNTHPHWHSVFRTDL